MARQALRRPPAARGAARCRAIVWVQHPGWLCRAARAPLAGIPGCIVEQPGLLTPASRVASSMPCDLVAAATRPVVSDNPDHRPQHPRLHGNALRHPSPSTAAGRFLHHARLDDEVRSRVKREAYFACTICDSRSAAYAFGYRYASWIFSRAAAPGQRSSNAIRASGVSTVLAPWCISIPFSSRKRRPTGISPVLWRACR
jgi:hypothetical protein